MICGWAWLALASPVIFFVLNAGLNPAYFNVVPFLAAIVLEMDWRNTASGDAGRP